MPRVRQVFVAVVCALACSMGVAPTASAEVDPVVWLCRPGQVPDPCVGDQTETVVGRDGAPDSVLAEPGTSDSDVSDSEPKVDCFYVYPTISLAPSSNAPDLPPPELSFIAGQQVQRFAPKCRIFAPVYRQSTLAGLATSQGAARGPALDVAFGDVLRAWDEYIARDNDGRGIVLIGHSQGSTMLRGLIRQRIDNNVEMRGRLVSAILPGSNVTVRKGSVVGGDFDSVPGCTQQGEIGCVIAYSMYATNPPSNSQFGRVPFESVYGAALDLPYGPDYDVLCTNPASLGANDRSALHPVLRSVVRIPGTSPVVVGANAVSAATPFVVPNQDYTARCESADGAAFLDIDGGNAASLPTVPSSAWGLHLQDVNLALGDLTDMVAAQTQTYLATAGR